MKTLIVFVFTITIQNCVWLDVQESQKLIQKKEISTREYEIVEEELLSDGKKIFTQDQLVLPIKKNILTKRMKETNFKNKYKIERQKTSSFYIIGGLIPFVTEESGMGKYFMIAFATSIWSFPVTIADWVSLPFRTIDSEEFKEEREEIVLSENKTESEIFPETIVKIQNKEYKVINKQLVVPFSEIVDFWIAPNGSPIDLNFLHLEYEIISPNNTISKREPLAKFFTEEEYHTILLSDAINRPEVHKDILTYFIYKVCLLKIEKAYDQKDADRIVNEFKAKYNTSKKYCTALILQFDSNWHVVGYSDNGDFQEELIEPNSQLFIELQKPERDLDKMINLSLGKIKRKVAVGNDLKIINKFINLGYPVNASNANKPTPLQAAIACKNQELVKYLQKKE